MIVKYEEKLTGIRFAAPTANIFKFHGEPGTLTDLDIWVDFAAASGDNIFNLLINGVAQFVGAARPKIVAGGFHATKTGLSIAIADGDIISIDLQSAAASGLTLPAYFRASIETGKGDLEALMFAVSDETTAITTGTAKLTVRMPYAFKLSTAPPLLGVRANVNTVSSSGAVQVDINEGGASILSTKLTIDASEKTSTTAATPAVISDPDLADDAEVTFDIDSAGTGAKGLKVTLLGRRV
jgi:hypothetical protein